MAVLLCDDDAVLLHENAHWHKIVNIAAEHRLQQWFYEKDLSGIQNRSGRRLFVMLPTTLSRVWSGALFRGLQSRSGITGLLKNLVDSQGAAAQEDEGYTSS